MINLKKFVDSKIVPTIIIFSVLSGLGTWGFSKIALAEDVEQLEQKVDDGFDLLKTMLLKDQIEEKELKIKIIEGAFKGKVMEKAPENIKKTYKDTKEELEILKQYQKQLLKKQIEKGIEP